MRGLFSFKTKYASYPAIVSLFFIIFLVVYAPVIQTAYLYLDDWGHYTPAGRSIGFFIDAGIMQGRNISSFFLYISTKLFNSFESTKLIRFIGIIGLVFFAFVTYAVFKRSRFRSDHAFLMSTLICLLPSSQIIVSWMVCIPYFFSAAMSSLSALIYFNFASKGTNKGRRYKIMVLLSAIILLVSALNIYQTAAMMYWSMGIIFFISRDNYNLSKKDFRQFVITYFSVGLISIALYYLVFMKVIPAYFYPHLSMKGGILTNFHDVPQIVKWFITRPFKHAINLWHLNPTKNVAIFISSFIFIGIIFNTLREIKQKKEILVSSYFINFILISSLLILSYLPHIIVGFGHAYRYMIAFAPALSIVFFFALINIVEFIGFIANISHNIIVRVITVFLLIITVIAAFSAHNNVNDFASLHSNEFNYVKNALKEHGVINLLKTSMIYVRRAKYHHVPVEHRQNEFQRNIVTHSQGDWIFPRAYSIRGIEQGEIGGGMARYVVKLALHDIGFKQDIHITHGATYDPIPEDKNTFVIDMVQYQMGSQIMRLVDFGDEESTFFRGSGWSFEDSSGTTAWTISRKATLIGKLSPKESIKMVALISSPHPNQKIDIRFNGRTIATWNIEKASDFHEYNAIIKLSAAEKTSFTRVDFITEKIDLVPDKDDERKLGILVDWVRFE